MFSVRSLRPLLTGALMLLAALAIYLAPSLQAAPPLEETQSSHLFKVQAPPPSDPRPVQYLGSIYYEGKPFLVQELEIWGTVNKEMGSRYARLVGHRLNEATVEVGAVCYGLLQKDTPVECVFHRDWTPQKIEIAGEQRLPGLLEIAVVLGGCTTLFAFFCVVAYAIVNAGCGLLLSLLGDSE